MIEKYIGLEDGKTYYIVYGALGEEAIRMVNRRLKVSKMQLKARIGYVFEDRLYWEQINKKAQQAWVIWKE